MPNQGFPVIRQTPAARFISNVATFGVACAIPSTIHARVPAPRAQSRARAGLETERATWRSSPQGLSMCWPSTGGTLSRAYENPLRPADGFNVDRVGDPLARPLLLISNELARAETGP
jgi:hypothetical protein